MKREHRIGRDIRILEQKYRRRPASEPTETDEGPPENVVGGGPGGWVEVDPNFHLSQVTIKASWNDLENEEAAYLYKPKSFGTSFTHKLDFKVYSIFIQRAPTSADYRLTCIWLLSENYGRPGFVDCGDQIELWIQENGSSTTQYYLYLTHAEENVWDNSVMLNVGSVYYLTITRVTNVFTVKIYSDSARTNLIDEISIDVTGEEEDGLTFSYIETTASWDGFATGSPDKSTGYVENIKLNL